jgi:hypothetical protein
LIYLTHRLHSIIEKQHRLLLDLDRHHPLKETAPYLENCLVQTMARQLQLALAWRHRFPRGLAIAARNGLRARSRI